MCSPRRLNSRMHKDARKSWNFPEGESTEMVKTLYSAAQRKAKRRHFVLCELSRLSLELNATHIHIFESVYKRARNIDGFAFYFTCVGHHHTVLYACGVARGGPHIQEVRDGATSRIDS